MLSSFRKHPASLSLEQSMSRLYTLILTQKIDKIGERPSKWQDFLDALPDKDFRFGVFDFEFVNADNMHKSKLAFINWNSDSAPMKVRVLYATAK